MDSPGFIHLRLRSEYSITDSIVRLDGAIARAVGDGQPALALTDAGNLFGWIRFYKAALKKGVQPILGCDLPVCDPADPTQSGRLLLIAATRAGYTRLCELVSRAWLENPQRDQGALHPDWLTPEQTGGLIALSGAAQGLIGQHLIAGRQDEARALAQRYAAGFPDAFYLEVQRDGSEHAERCTRATARLALELDLPLVATHPIQFLDGDEYRAHEARVCIAEGEVLANPRRVSRFTREQFFLTRAQMQERFADLPAALANSVAIAQRCSLTMQLGKSFLPHFPIPDGMTVDDFLQAEAQRGLEARLVQSFPDPAERAARRAEYDERLQIECGTIIGMGFPGYFLIVADFIGWAKANQVPVGPGRGSGAGSLVAWSLGITDLDPLPYALLFERFLNPERVSMPDFDIDFCQDNRGRVIEYVRNKYGHDAVSQIATFGTMASKAVVRDAGRVLDLPYSLCDQISKLIPIEQARPMSLEKALQAEPTLAERYRNEEEVQGLIDLARPLEDLCRNVGMHAGGVLIAPGKLTDFCPLYKAPGADSGVVSQYDKDDVEAVGLVKFDFLGLRNLTIIDLAVRYVNERRAREGREALDLTRLTFDDPGAYQILKDGNTIAIFQVESDGMKKLLRKLQPDRFEDIIAVLALYRPGPLGSGMVDDFILRKRGKQAIDYFHPDLKDCLDPTYGVIVYQEQVMQIAQIIAGYTLGGADLLRRAMGKKKAEEMARQRATFLEGARSLGHTDALAAQLFDLMEKFAEYGFNKSHTAAYAVVTYQTAWLKRHYCAEFMAGTLSSDMDDTDKVQLFVRDAQANGVTIALPDINRSHYHFRPEGEGIVRYGLGAVKGTGQAAVECLLAARTGGGPFRDLFDFCARVDRHQVNRRTIEALVRAGAFHALEPDRARLIANVPQAMDAAEQQARMLAAGQGGLFGGADSGLEHEAEATVQEWLAHEPWDEARTLAEEKTALGFCLSGHLFNSWAPEVRRFVKTRIADLDRMAEHQPRGQETTVAGVISAVGNVMTRSGKRWLITLDDGTAQTEIGIFAELYDRHRALLREDALLIVQGKVSRDDRNGGYRFNVGQMLDLAAARARAARSVRLRINGNANAAQLAAVLEPHRVHDPQVPACPVEIDYHNDRARAIMRLGPDWQVRPTDDLLVSLRAWLKPDCVQIVYK